MEKILLYLVGLMAVSEAFFISNREFRRIFSFVPRNDENQHTLRHRNNNLRQHHRYPENIRDQINNSEDYYNEDNYEERNDNYSRNKGYYRNDKFLRPSSAYNNKHIHHAGCDHGHDEDHDYHHHHTEQRRNQKNYKPKYEMVDGDEDYPEQKPKYYRNERNSKSKNKAEENHENDTQTIFLSPEKIDGNYKKDYVTGVLVTIPKTKPVENEENQNNYNPLQFIQKFFQPTPEENTEGQVYENFKVY